MIYNEKKEYNNPINRNFTHLKRTSNKNRVGISLVRSMKKAHSLLSGNDALLLLEIINSSLYCNTQDDFRDLFKKLENLFLFDAAVSALANFDGGGSIVPLANINISYPDEWIKLYCENDFHKIDTIAAENYSTFEPQYWEDTHKKRSQSKDFLSAAESFGLHRGYSHGSSPFGHSKEGSIFSFSSCCMTKFDERVVTILKLVVPHLHRALSVIVNNTSNISVTNRLTFREKEVLNWIKLGKSSWDISAILNISENTVNYHIKNIFHKLDVVNRTQAVATAGYLGLIDFD